MLGSSVGLLAGPIGALIGGYFGHQFDEKNFPIEDEKKAKVLYYAYFFSAAAKIAKANGNISAEEIEQVESIIQRMELSPSLEKFAKDVFEKAKPAKDQLIKTLKNVPNSFSITNQLGPLFWEDYSKLQTARIKNQAMHRFNAYFPARNTSGCPKERFDPGTPEDMPMLNLLWGKKDLSSCYEILGVSPEASFRD